MCKNPGLKPALILRKEQVQTKIKPKKQVLCNFALLKCFKSQLKADKTCPETKLPEKWLVVAVCALTKEDGMKIL